MTGVGCLHELFERAAGRAPEAPAVEWRGVVSSYRDVAARADRLARRLRRLGVGPESPVGLAVDRSPARIEGILGILKAGGAYVPLDPSYPPARLELIWRDVRRALPEGRLPVLVTLESLAGSVPAEGAERVYLDGSGAALEREAAGRLAGGAGPDSLAYVIYTSGTTGTPKGVLVPHRGAVAVARHNARLLRVGPESRVLQLASLSFDASVLEVFTAFAAGACLVLAEREALLSGEALVRALREGRITTLAIPPSLLDTVPAGEEPPGLTGVVVGGEACPAATAARWAPGRILVNAYAPTEATIYATAERCRPPFDAPPALGEPIPGATLRLLGPDLRPPAAGEDGEICLGGAGTARGYLGRPGLTAERFVPDPAAGEGGAGPGARLYRSGDLGRRRLGGRLEFAGRIDDQVKVRGVRIEPGEIEARLAEHPAVRHAAVVAREDAAGDRRLVAYAVPRDGAAPSTSELRAHLARTLPAELVPSAFVLLDALPLAPTGKVDRGALPPPGRERPDLAVAYAAPRTALERRLARIVGDLLGLDRVGVDDDLFELGGHSLVVTRLASRVRSELDRELALPEVFARPTVRALASRLEAAPRAAGDDRRPPPIERAPRDRDLPLSFPQERIWFLHQLAPDTLAYGFQFTVRFRGVLAPAALGRALTEIVRRHEVLRTTFPARSGRPVQAIHPPFRVALPVVDLGALPAARREAVARALVARAIRRPFDLERLPLFRPALVRLGPGDHLFLQVEHHFVHDGWSLALYLRELLALYRAYAEGRPSPLPEPPIQYADFAAWQRRWMAGETLERELAFWRARLPRDLAPLELPADRRRPRVHGFRGGALRVDMAPALYAAARAFARARGVTLFMTLLAAFEALLARTTGRREFLLGSGVANRRLRETEELIGMVVNTVVLPCRIDGRAPFLDLLERVRRTTLEVHEHQDLPFERLVEELQPERDLSRNPLFQVLFSFHDAAVPDLELPGLAGELFEWHNGTAKADLNVVVKPMVEQRVGRARTGDEALTMVWEYSSDLFEPATAERLWSHYRTLLAAALESPERTVAELPLLTGAEADQLRVWGRGGGEPPAASVPELVAARAAERPAAPAVVAAGRILSYGDLTARAALLAGELRSLGIGPGSLVAVLAGPSAETAVAALAAWRAGAAYLPLDPSHPEERLRFLLEDAGAAALVTAREPEAGLAERLARPRRGRALPVLAVDAAAPLPPAAGRGAPAPGHRPGPEELAYVIYTSGSTGKPKGVEVTHRGLANLAAWHRAAYAPGPGDRATLVAGPGFDASVWELWGHLPAGASLHVPDERTRTAPDRLLAWLAAEGITHAFLPTPLAAAVVAEIERRGAPPAGLALSWLLTGGDRLHRPPGVPLPFRLVNHYGPTESAVVTSAGEVGFDGRTPPSIGRPIAGLEVRLLDPALRPVPVGVPGELCVGGAGLARGYRGRPAATAERFVPDPGGGAAGGPGGVRLYRTGDLARWLPDGALDFLGRLDAQVQIRGLRVEPGEVEALLAGHPGVRAAAVVSRERPGGDTVLVAYVVPEAAPPPAVEELRAALARWLPEAMVPARFALLDALPLNASGKVDRRALPEVDWEGGFAAAASVPPRGPMEELVAGVWAEVLGRDGVGAHDDFFVLGGHSLLATQVVSRLRELTGAEVALSELFDAPTVAGLAAAVGRLAAPVVEAVAAGAPVPPLSPIGRGGELSASFAQERLWFLERLGTEGASYSVPVAVRLRGPLDGAVLAAALREVVGRHEVLRTVLRATAAGGVCQVVLPASPVPLSRLDLAGVIEPARRPELDRLARGFAGRPFDLARGPVLRAALVRLGPAEHALCLAFHHAAADGWSMAVLFRELWAAYAAAAAGPGAEEARPPAPPIQYADYAAWQRAWLAGATLERLLGHWRDRLAGLPAALELPFDRPRPERRSTRGGRESFALPPELTRRLAELARDAGATLFMVLLAAFQALLARLAATEDVAVGTPVANRGRREVEGLIGCFVNTLVMRGDLAGDPPFRRHLDRVRAAALDAYVHQDLPFERLVAELAPERRLSHTPLFQVMLALQSSPPPGAPPPGLEVERLPVELPSAKFDLALELEEAGGGLAGRAAYARDLFDATTVRRWLGSWRALLEGVVAEPTAPVSALPLLSAAQRQQLLREWQGAGPAPAAEGVPVHEQVRRVAERVPDAVALVSDRDHLSYAELLRRSGALAGRLRALGARPEEPVGLLLERSPAAVVGVLGVLEAGGGYLPLDPGAPAERLRLMLADAGARWVVIGRPAPTLPAGVAAVPADDGDDGRAGPTAGGGAAAPAAPAGDLAYVLYTSGSTGKPKGVMVPHGSLASHMAWMARALPLAPADRLLQKTPLGFDASVWELFAPLLAGACLVLARPGGHRDPAYLVEALRRERITVLQGVPSLLRLLAAEEGLAACADLRRLASGGEELPADLAERLAGMVQVELVNLYGPTETTIQVAWWRRRAGEAAAPAPGSGAPPAVPLGRPIDGVRVTAVDRALRPVPPGVAGELLVGSAAVSRGYLGRPALTAECFVPDPFGPPGARGYRTGDLGRLLADGRLLYAGRADRQLKLRGTRIEPGEVEAALAALPWVRRAAVVAREDVQGEPRLVAYLEPAGAVPGAADIRRLLAARLPEAMVPADFVVLDELPATASGKLDRRALPAPAAGRVAAGGAWAAPRGPVEELVAAAFAEALGLERLGREARFFDLGGHSLLALRLVARLRDLLGVELPLQRLFDAPSVAAVAAWAGEALRGGAPPAGQELVPVPRRGGLPASFAQERIWFLDRFEGERRAYTVPMPVRLSGRLRPAALAAALGGVIRRHEALRTVLRPAESWHGGALQVVRPPGPARLPVVDLGRLPAGRAAAEARRSTTADARRPFDLERGPVLRAALLRLGGDDHVLLLTVHHVATDAWSARLLWSELAALYRARLTGEPAALPALPIQYADWALWRRRRQAEAETALEGWRLLLDGAPTLLPLPADRPRAGERSSRGGSRSAALPAALAADLERLGRARGATPFMTLLAAFQVLLGRLAGVDDLLVGSPVSGRDRTEVQGLIGLFLDTLVLRGRLDGDPTFAEVLARTRRATLDAFALRDLPFERLVAALVAERSLAHPPLVQAGFTLEEPAGAPAAGDDELPGLEAAPWPVETGEVKLDLSLTVRREGEGLLCRLDFARDLFDGATAERWLGAFGALLRQVAEDPERPVATLDLVAPEERRLLLEEWGNGPARPAAGPATLHGLVAAQAAAAPGRPAVTRDGEALAYGELVAGARRLGRYLAGLGVGAEAPVGVLLERRPALVTALLGVLEAGGCYVPLDPGYPPERLAAMAADAGVVAVVSERSLAALAEALTPPGARRVEIDGADRAGIAGQEPAALERPIGPDHLAYVLYTSGSTGKPKGVEVRHGGAVAFLGAMARRPGVGPEDVVLATTTVSFDISVLELFLPLAVGARVELVDRETAADGRALAARLDEVTVAQATPTSWRMLLDSGWRGRPGLKALSGGEPLDRELAGRLLAAVDGAGDRSGGGAGELWNVYGPTETTVWSTAGRVAPGAGPVAIGEPIAETRLYVVDRRGELCPVRVPGELWIAGAGVARGYRGRPGATAERFVPEPAPAGPAEESGGRPGGRAYRTGDLVRWRADGALECLGRLDHQVKVRGHRIEPGEIEAALLARPEVARAAVVPFSGGAGGEGGAGTVRLAAYLVLEPGAPEPTVEALRAGLAETLPEYMVPAAFAVVSELPATPNGKVDRKALAALGPGAGAARPALGEDYVAPETEAERALAAVWREVLGVERVGARDRFFSLGGDSILALQVVTRAARAGWGLAVPDLFRHPSLGDLAAAARPKRRPAAPPPSEPAPAGFPDLSAAGLDSGELEELLAEIDR